MRSIEKLGYTLWYGTFVLFGITFGLLLYPLLADAYEIVSDDFENYSLGNLAPYGGWSTSSAQVIPQVVNTTFSVAPQSGSKMIYFGDSSRQVLFPKSTTTYATSEAVQTLSYYFYPYDFTSGTNAPGALMSFVTYSVGNVSQQTFYTCFYPTSNSVATFRISSGSNCNSGTITSVEYNIPQGGWVSVECSWTRSDNKFACALNGSSSVQYTGAMDTDNYYIVPTTFTGYTYGEGFLDNFGWSETSGGGGGSSTSTTYITNVYPVDETYDVATTSYVNMTVQIPSARYAQNSWKAKVACAEILDNTWFQSLTDYGFSYTVDLDDGDCGVGASCTPHGVSYPPDGEIEANAVYNCTAVLYEAKWYWFDTQIEKKFFRFYTFSSTSTSEFADLIARADELQGSVNLTGTSTNPVFGDCSILNGQISDCVIEPIKYLIIPSATDKDNIKELIDTTVFDKFPFSYVGLFNQDMASSSFYATTTAEFPDFAFSTQNMNGVTTTVTIFDGSQFVSSWSTVSEFDTLRTAIQYALLIMFTTILYFRVRRLIPSSDNVQGI